MLSGQAATQFAEVLAQISEGGDNLAECIGTLSTVFNEFADNIFSTKVSSIIGLTWFVGEMAAALTAGPAAPAVEASLIASTRTAFQQLRRMVLQTIKGSVRRLRGGAPIPRTLLAKALQNQLRKDLLKAGLREGAEELAQSALESLLAEMLLALKRPGHDIDWGKVGLDGLIGGLAGIAGGLAAGKLNSVLGNRLTSSNVARGMRGLIVGATADSVGTAAAMLVGGIISGDLSSLSLNEFLGSAFAGGLVGGTRGYRGVDLPAGIQAPQVGDMNLSQPFGETAPSLANAHASDLPIEAGAAVAAPSLDNQASATSLGDQDNVTAAPSTGNATSQTPSESSVTNPDAPNTAVSEQPLECLRRDRKPGHSTITFPACQLPLGTSAPKYPRPITLIPQN